MIIMFNRNEPVKLTPKDHLIKRTKYFEKENTRPFLKVLKERNISKGKETHAGYKFVVRKQLNARMVPHIFFTPFEVVDLILTVTFRKLKIKGANKKHVHINFNLQDKLVGRGSVGKINFTQDGEFGNYELAEKRFIAEYTHRQSPKSLIFHKKNLYNCECFEDQSFKIQSFK